ncbi:MAG: methyltransferase family protein [Candidatus Thorarchaeota archaeon]
MKLKGIDKLREKIPNYEGKKILIFPVLGMISCIAGVSFQILLDVLSRINPGIQILAIIEPVLPVIGSVIVATIGLRLVTKLWRDKEKAIDQHGKLAYQRMMRYGVSGVFLMPAVFIHAFLSIRSLPPGPPVNELTIAFSKSLLTYIAIPLEFDVTIRIILAAIFFVGGILTVRSSIETFGLDYMVVVYLYFPEESELNEHEIYSVIRHPAYFSAIVLGISALFFRFSIYSIVFFVILFVMLKLHISVEEKELIERFGESYLEYKERVPGLYVRPRDLGVYLRFLFGRNSPSS